MYAVTVALTKDNKPAGTNSLTLSRLTFFFEAPSDEYARQEVSKRLAGTGWQQVATPR